MANLFYFAISFVLDLIFIVFLFLLFKLIVKKMILALGFAVFSYLAIGLFFYLVIVPRLSLSQNENVSFYNWLLNLPGSAWLVFGAR